MTGEELVKMWADESNAANDCIIEILESYMEFIDLVERASHVQHLRDWLKVQPIMRTLLKKRRKQWTPILEHAKKAKEIAQQSKR